MKIVNFIVNLALILLALAIYLGLPQVHEPLENRLRDILFQARGERPASFDRISIVAIDEQSLKAQGQWPWERNKLAQMLINLDAAGALIIGLDIFFAEADKSSPQRIARTLGLPAARLPDYDRQFARAIDATPVVLSYVFHQTDMHDSTGTPSEGLQLLGSLPDSAFVPWAKGFTGNLPLFNQVALTSGFVNFTPDEGGMVRRVPLINGYQSTIHGSLAFEIFHLLNEAPPLQIAIEPTGISHLQLGNRRIPTDDRGRLFLNYLGPPGAFSYLSATDVISGHFDSRLVKDRIILVGATASGLKDLRPTPFDRSAPGVETHATVLENLLGEQYLQKPDWAMGADIAFMALLGLGLTLIYPFLPAYLIMLIMLATLYAIQHLNAWLLFERGLITSLLFPMLVVLLVTLSSSLIGYFSESRLKQRIKSSFSKKLSPAVVEDILRHGDEQVLIGRSCEVSIFFSDIRNFTRLTEQLGSAQKVIDLLNIYMTPMVDAVMHTGGTVDKLIGDAIMAYWNAPRQLPNHADLAVDSALRQLQLLEAVNRQLQSKYAISIDIGIGINTGEVIVGEMGSAGRSDYTIIGDAVNLASRLEGLCKLYGSRILISSFTREKLTRRFTMRELDLVCVKGKQEPVAVFEVLPPGAQTSDAQLTRYQDALQTYRAADFAGACKAFDALQAETDSPLYRLYQQRCQHYLSNPPDAFNGVFVLNSK
jgi:adenylate cyclase